MALPDQPTPAPEALLLRAARQGRRPRKLSMREAARMSDVSETTWRHAESGFEPRGGFRFAYRAGDATLARMARTVGLVPEQLEQAGRQDAARILRAMQDGAPGDRHFDDLRLQRIWERIRTRFPGEAGHSLMDLILDVNASGEERGSTA